MSRLRTRENLNVLNGTKTTDRVNAEESSVVPFASLSPEEERQPSTPIEPAVEQAIELEFAEPVQRSTLRLAAIHWAEVHHLDSILTALAETGERVRLTKGTADEIANPARYAGSMLAEWKKKGKITARLVSKRARKLVADARRDAQGQKQALEKQEARRLEEAREEAEIARRARWEAVPECQRLAIEAQVRKGVAYFRNAKSGNPMFVAACIERLGVLPSIGGQS